MKRPTRSHDTAKNAGVTDEHIAILDDALTAAESELRKIRNLPPRQVAVLFSDHVLTHLSEELSNIVAHGHRNDDADDVPQAQHTPGPWHVSPDQANHGESLCVQTDDGFIVVRVPSVHPHDNANAQIIAAAPDMLEVLESVAARWDKDDDRDAPELGAAIRNVIKKAKVTIARIAGEKRTAWKHSL